MATKLLDAEARKEFQELVQQGVPPGDLVDRFNVSMTTIYNYKRLLKAQGLEVPNVHGKRPSGRFAPDYVDPQAPPARLRVAEPAAEAQYATLYLRHEGVDFTVVVDARAKVYMEAPGQVLITFP